MRETVVLLGAGPGLGKAIAERFARDGHTVILLARNQAHAAELAASIKGSEDVPAATVVEGLAADASDSDSLRSALSVLRQRWGDPSVLVHNPSLSTLATATATTVNDLMSGLRLSVGSLLVAAQELAPAMVDAGRGAIFVTGSQAALAGSTWSASLGVQKAAIRNLTFSLAKELRPAGIHVTTITIHGVLGASDRFQPPTIADAYARLLAEEPGVWRDELDYR